MQRLQAPIRRPADHVLSVDEIARLAE